VLLDQPALLKKISMLMMTFMIVNGKYMSIEQTEDNPVSVQERKEELPTDSVSYGLIRDQTVPPSDHPC
jgi:hypothetical protein